jgi:NNP family nitrate/nitrite transporter-like MFS transporter
MIGEIGALGGGILPNLLGQSKQHTGSYRGGFLLYAALAVGVLILMRIAARSWTHSWVASAGRALNAAPDSTTVIAVAAGHAEEIPA